MHRGADAAGIAEDAQIALDRETVAMFGADRCCYGSSFPIEKLWTDYKAPYRDIPECHRSPR
jgi:predicted TIM-barrel fold metal-dependent hydrolase